MTEENYMVCTRTDELDGEELTKGSTIRCCSRCGEMVFVSPGSVKVVGRLECVILCIPCFRVKAKTTPRYKLARLQPEQLNEVSQDIKDRQDEVFERVRKHLKAEP